MKKLFVLAGAVVLVHRYTLKNQHRQMRSIH